jgi:Concanavalin A-like lectin/glucanases superfamily
MPDTVIGRGGIVLTVTNPSPPTATTRTVRYEIRADGIKFYADASRTAVRLFDLLGSSTATGKGHLTLEALPATPQASFQAVTLTYGNDKFVLEVKQAEAFARRTNIYFKNLTLKFTELKSSVGVTVEGSVIAVLCDREIPLTAELTSVGALVFRKPTSQTVDLPIDPTGTYRITTLEVAAAPHKWDGLQVLYTFDEGAGATILDVSGVGTPLDLTVRDSAATSWFPGGLAITGATIINSTAVATKVLTACQSSQEITIEAWVKPAKKNQESPARIVTLSGDRENRNFALQQGVWRQSLNKLDPEVYAARLRTTRTDNSGESPIDIPIGAFKTDLVHLVYTRDQDGNARLYVNGVEQMWLKVEGDFSNWDRTYRMVLANEFTNDRSWLGEYHLVAVYSRALTPETVLQNIYPIITTTGDLNFTTVPAPLNSLTGIKLEHFLKGTEPERSVLSFRSPAAMPITPDLQLEKVNFTWKKFANAPWAFTGTLTTRLWGNPLDSVAQFNSTPVLLSLVRRDSSSTTLTLDGLGTIPLKQFGLYTAATLPPTWELQTDGQITFTTIAPPLKGPFPAQLGIVNGQLQLNLAPPSPLPLVESLAFEGVNLNFFRSAAGWETQGAISLRFLDRALPLVAKFVGDGAARGLTLDWAADPATPTPFTDAVGRWVLARLSLQPIVPAGNAFWQLAVNGTVALATRQNTPAGVMALTLEGQVVGELANLAKPTRLTGSSRLQQFTDSPIFNGTIELRGDRFALPGRLTFFPLESPLQVNSDVRLEVDPQRRVSFQSPAEFKLPDVQLVDPTLKLDGGRLSLRGRWLGESLSLTAIQRGQQLLWQGEATFQLPFSLTLGALYEPRTSIKLTDRVKVCQDAGCLQELYATVPLEWSAAGFLAQVNGVFQWQDQTRSLHNMVVPPFQLFAAPTTRNILLGSIVQEIRTHADEIFAPEFKHESDYFIIPQEAQPVIYYGPRSAQPTTLTTELPQVLTAAATITDGKSPIGFQLVQTATTCTLTINANISGLEEAYQGFLANLATQEKAGVVLTGAVNLIKARIAERVPATLDRTLFYYYSLDTSRGGFLDLQAGMRLRVDYQNYQNVPPTERTASAINGFVGSGSADYMITSYRQTTNAGAFRYLLGFDPFLSRLTSVMPTDTAKEGAGGGLDFLKPGFRQPYYRLFYPNQFSDLAGARNSERAITIVGAINFSELRTATDQYLRNGAIQLSTDNSRVSFFFRGRVTVIPEITVFVQEQPVDIPVGTTLRQLIERYTTLPPAGFRPQDLQSFRGRLRPRRTVHEGVNSTPSDRFIDLDNYQLFDNGMDQYDLPLVKGDRLYF